MRYLSTASRAAFKTRPSIRSIFSVLMLMLVFPLGLHAQQYSGTIVGTGATQPELDDKRRCVISGPAPVVSPPFRRLFPICEVLGE